MRKKVFAFMAMLFIVGMLAACGGSDEAAPSRDNDGEVVSDEVQLKVFIAQPRFKEIYEPYLNQFAEKYEEEEGVKVTFQLEMPGVNESGQILQTRLASNDSPDIFTVHAINDIPRYDRAGYLEDLSDQPFVDMLLDTPREAVTRDDRVVAAPLESLHWGFLYNEDIFEEY